MGGCSIGPIVGGQHATVDSFRNESAKRKKCRKPGAMDHLAKQIGMLGNKAINRLDKIVTWLVGDEPTHNKERLTWTSPRFPFQRRVRKDRSSGQGYNKQKIGNNRMIPDGGNRLFAGYLRARQDNSF